MYPVNFINLYDLFHRTMSLRLIVSVNLMLILLLDVCLEASSGHRQNQSEVLDPVMQQWIKEHPNLEILLEVDYPGNEHVWLLDPYVTTFCDRLSRQTGLKISCRVIGRHSELGEFRKTSRDPVAVLGIKNSDCDEAGFVTTEPWLVLTQALFVNRNANIDSSKIGAGHTLAISPEWTCVDSIKQQYPDAGYLELDSGRMGLERLAEGQVDGWIGPEYFGKSLIKTYDLDAIVWMTNCPDLPPLEFLFRLNPEQGILLEILNQVIMSSGLNDTGSDLNEGLDRIPANRNTYFVFVLILIATGVVGWIKIHMTLRNRIAFLIQALGAVPELVFIKGIDGTIYWQNDQARIYQNNRLLMLAASDSRMAPPPDLFGVKRDDFEEGIVELQREFEGHGSGDTVCQYAASYRLENIGKRKVIVGIIHEVTDIRRMEQNLRENRDLYRSLFEQSNDAAWLMLDGRTVECNVRAMDMFRASSLDELLGRTPLGTLAGISTGRGPFRDSGQGCYCPGDGRRNGQYFSLVASAVEWEGF